MASKNIEKLTAISVLLNKVTENQFVGKTTVNIFNTFLRKHGEEEFTELRLRTKNALSKCTALITYTDEFTYHMLSSLDKRKLEAFFGINTMHLASFRCDVSESTKSVYKEIMEALDEEFKADVITPTTPPKKKVKVKVTKVRDKSTKVKKTKTKKLSASKLAAIAKSKLRKENQKSLNDINELQIRLEVASEWAKPALLNRIAKLQGEK